MPVYRHRKGVWRVRVWIKGIPHQWNVEGTKKAAEAFEARKRTELEEANPAADLRVVPRFSDFCVKTYKPHAELHLKASSFRNRQYTLTTLIEHFGELRLSEIGTAHVEGFKATRSKAKIRPSTINDDCKVLLAVLNYARELGHPIGKLKVKKLTVRGERKPHAWTLAEVGSLYGATTEKSPEILPLVTFLANTGCRRGEAIALTWENVDFERRVIRIWPSDEWQPKSGKPREVPINDALLPWLQGARKSPRWVFPSRHKVDGALQPYIFWPQRAFDRAREHAKLTGGPHTLRHTYATHFLATTPDLYLLARVLGHSYTRVTELYAHLLPDSLTRAGKAVSFPTSVTPAALEVAAKWARRAKAAKAGVASGRARRGEAAPAEPTNVVALPVSEQPAESRDLANRPQDRPPQRASKR